MKRFGKIVAVLILILAAGVVISVIHHYQLRAATQNYIAELKAKGEPMELSQVVLPSVPPEQNGADLLRQADEMFLTNKTFLSSNYFFGGMEMVAPGKAAVVSEQPDYRDHDQTNSWKEIQEAVTQNANAYALLHQILRKPNFGGGIDYGQGIDKIVSANLLLPEAKAAALRLEVAALSDLHRGDIASATEDVHATLAVAHGIQSEHLLISGLVRIAVAAIAAQGTWEILQSTNVTDEQLQSLQKDWASVEFFRPMETAFVTERAANQFDINNWRKPNSDFERNLVNPVPWAGGRELTFRDRATIRYRLFCWRYWWSYPDEIRALKGDELMLQALRAAQTNNALLSIQKELESNLTKLAIPTDGSTEDFWETDPRDVDLHFALSGSVLTSAKVFSRVVKIETEKRMVITAIALTRYHLKHGEYPATLDVLVPEFLSAIPRDLDGKPLRYQRNADRSFTLYSVGDNGVDNGGDPTPTLGHKSSFWWEFGRDWVWPQRATAGEIRKFHANPPK